MKIQLILILAVTALLSFVSSIMVPTGKLTPITPPLPPPAPKVVYPLRDPAPVYEDPEPGYDPPPKQTYYRVFLKKLHYKPIYIKAYNTYAKKGFIYF